MTEANSFTPGQIGLSLTAAALIQAFFFTTLILAGTAEGRIEAEKPPERREIPLKVKPVMDDLPLLKLGGKKVKAKLPDMWKKNPPVQRFEAKSAPSPEAGKTVEDIPDSAVAERDAEAPSPDAEVAKEVDQVLLDAGPDAEPTVEGEGSPDGVKEGTETDPLKARAVSQYMAKILGWFNARFSPPVGQIPCEELKQLSTAVAATVGGDRSVTGYSITRPSGNPTFDAKVRATMDGIVGQQLPPPPPLYPDILGSTVQPVFSGRGAKCD